MAVGQSTKIIGIFIPDPPLTNPSWWFQPPLKNMLVKWDHFPKFRGEHKNIFETTKSKTHDPRPFVYQWILLESWQKGRSDWKSMQKQSFRIRVFFSFTPRKINMWDYFNRKYIFQPSFFRGYLVSGRVNSRTKAVSSCFLLLRDNQRMALVGVKL